MIKLFKTTADLTDVLTTNGDLVLKPIKAVIHQTENSEFYLELETTLDYLNDFVYGYQIVADYLGDYEIFRIGAVTATRDKLKVKCPHITYDTDFMFWYDDPYIPGEMPPRAIGDRSIYVTDLNKVLDFIYTGVSTVGASTVCFGRKRRIDLDLTAYPISEQHITITNGCSLTEMMNTLLKQYGGYVYRHHYDYKIIPDRITNDTQELIIYGSNLKSISRQEVDSDYATGILAVGQSTDLNSASTSGGIMPCGDADAFMARRVKFDQSNIQSSSYGTQYAYQHALEDDLNAKATNYLTENASLKLSYNVKAIVEHVTGLWDNVMIRDFKLGVDVDATVISFQYDLLLKTFNEVVFGNYSKTMSGYNAKINDRIDTVWKDIPTKSYPIGTIITWTGGLVTNPNNANSGFEGYWVSLGNNTWQRVV